MQTMQEFTRRTALGLAVALGAGALLVTPAHADEAAETYISGILDEANVVFNAETEAERFAGIDALVDQYVDMGKVSRFTLGQYARVITDEQMAEYQPLFSKYAKLVYRKTLSEYSGQKLAVTGSVDRSAKDFIVNTEVVGAGPGDQFDGVTVHWRVYKSNDGSLSVIDAGAEGLWLAIEQQSQFKSVIANNGGGKIGIDALIKDLRSKVGG
jgi:phospholipid transport system substrate-binding protein